MGLPDPGHMKAGARVLVVNDDRLQLLRLVRLLEAQGLSVAGFTGADLALEAMGRETAPDLIVTDLHMPGLDGWGFCRLLRSPEFAAFNQVPILVVSATFSGEDPSRITADLGANGFLPAPVNGPRFLEAVRDLLAGKVPRQSPVVLIVEDSFTQAGIISRAFRNHGYEVRLAATGAEAIFRFKEDPPQVVVLDYHLPDMEGDTLLPLFREMDARAPVILITGDPDPGLALRATRLGARAYLRKPFDPEYLLTLCANARRELALLNVETLLEKRTQELRASETRLQLAMEATQDVIWDWNPKGGGLYLSARLAALLGESPQEVYSSLLAQRTRVHPEDRPQLRRALVALFRNHGDHFQEAFRLQHAGGEWVHVQARGKVLVRNPKGEVERMVGTLSDVSDRQRAEVALKQSRESLLRLFRLSPSAITLSRIPDGTFLEVNEGFCRYTGWRAEEVLGRSVLELGLWADPAERGRAQELLARDGEFHNFEAGFRTKDGEMLAGLMSGKIVDVEGKPCLMAVTTDITERKRAEQERGRLEEMLWRAQRLESIGSLAGGIAHDFNNLLAPIMGFAELVLDGLTPEDPNRDRLLQVFAAGQRGRELTRQLLAFSRKQVLTLRPVNLAGVIQGFQGLLRRAIREDIQLLIEVPNEEDLVRADVGQLEQVLMNLCLNAQDAMPLGGQLTLTLCRGWLGETPGSTSLPGSGGGPCLVLTVADTGSGMEPELLERIFEPFFTTKEVGKGTGLGLAVVFGIIHQHGGFITVDSEKGRGTAFHIQLPLLDPGTSLPAEAKGTSPRAFLCGERILLVEDDAQVRESTQALLLSQGLMVHAAEDLQGCLEILAREPVDLLLTDVILPGLNGHALHARLDEAYPGLPVVYMSGHPQEVLLSHGLGDQDLLLLRKPFTREELLSALCTARNASRCPIASVPEA